MSTWKDSQGREWNCTLDVLKLKKVKESLGINLMDCVAGNLLEELSTDVVKLVDVLYVLHQDQCEKRKLTDEDFAKGLFGDHLEEATAAFVDAIVDFCPSRQRQLLTLAMKKAKQEQDEAFEKIIGSLETKSTEESSKSQEN